MIFSKKTHISGFSPHPLHADNATKYANYHVSFWRNGHSKDLASCVAAARKKGAVGKITITHCVFDMSGGDRGGHDGAWQTIGDTDQIEKLEEWSEGRIKKLV